MTAGGTSFETVFEQELAKYSPLRQEIQANLQRQTSLIGEISVRRLLRVTSSSRALCHDSFGISYACVCVFA